MPISISLAESNPLILSGLSEAIGKDPRFSLVSTSGTAEGFVGMVIRVPVDIGIVAWDLPAMGGKRLIEVIRDQPHPPRIVISGRKTDQIVQQSLQAGAAAFCARETSAEELLDVCASVSEGKMVFPYTDIRAMERNPLASLTKREFALLESLATGATNRSLAKQFEISENTVKFHLSNLYDKLGANNRARAVALFLTLREDYYSNL